MTWTQKLLSTHCTFQFHARADVSSECVLGASFQMPRQKNASLARYIAKGKSGHRQDFVPALCWFYLCNFFRRVRLSFECESRGCTFDVLCATYTGMISGMTSSIQGDTNSQSTTSLPLKKARSILAPSGSDLTLEAFASPPPPLMPPLLPAVNQ